MLLSFTFPNTYVVISWIFPKRVNIFCRKTLKGLINVMHDFDFAGKKGVEFSIFGFCHAMNDFAEKKSRENEGGQFFAFCWEIIQSSFF